MSSLQQQPPSAQNEQTLQDCIINLQSRIAEHRTHHLQLLHAIASANAAKRALNSDERERLRGFQGRCIEVSVLVLLFPSLARD